jgi:hypothetical protein
MSANSKNKNIYHIIIMTLNHVDHEYSLRKIFFFPLTYRKFTSFCIELIIGTIRLSLFKNDYTNK